MPLIILCCILTVVIISSPLSQSIVMESPSIVMTSYVPFRFSYFCPISNIKSDFNLGTSSTYLFTSGTASVMLYLINLKNILSYQDKSYSCKCDVIACNTVKMTTISILSSSVDAGAQTIRRLCLIFDWSVISLVTNMSLTWWYGMGVVEPCQGFSRQ